MQFEIRTEECMVLEIDGHRSVMTREQVGYLYKHLANWLGGGPEECDVPAEVPADVLENTVPCPDKLEEEEKVLNAVKDHFARQRREKELRELQEEIKYYFQKRRERNLPCPRPWQLNPIVTCGKE